MNETEKSIREKSIQDARKRIAGYIKKCGYTYAVDNIVFEYSKYLFGWYVSHTAKDTITHCMKHLKVLASESIRAQAERENPRPLDLKQLKDKERVGKPD